MQDEIEHAPQTRLCFLGDQALAEGFALIGFETTPGATAADLDRLLGDLRQSRANAFVVVDQQLAAAGSRLLRRVYEEGGRVVVAEVPLLADPEGLRLDIDEQVRLLTGGQNFED